MESAFTGGQAPVKLGVVIDHICINLLVPRYTKTNIDNPGNQQN